MSLLKPLTASLGLFSQSELNVVSQMSVLGWDLTRLTTNAAEMDRTWVCGACVGWKIPLCERKKKIIMCICYAPAVKAFIHTGSPNAVHNATLTNVLPTTKPNERQ